MSGLYDDDFTLWTEQQATLLRRRAAGELVNDAELDWLNLAEEIEAVGGNTRSELRNRLARLLQHLLKRHYQPELRSRSWRAAIALSARRSRPWANRRRVNWRAVSAQFSCI